MKFIIVADFGVRDVSTLQCGFIVQYPNTKPKSQLENSFISWTTSKR